MPTLATKEYCTGCAACASICMKGCITMAADENGFLCPVIDAEKCMDCGLCEKTCPVLNPLKKAGKAPLAYAAYGKNEAVRMESTSGGIFTDLAKAVLRNGGAVYGAAYNDQFEVVHICVENEEGLFRLRGAKYAQSDIRGVFAEVKTRLDRGQQVLFSGTPCQVGGIKAFLCKDYENLLTVDFVCHSVPSPMAWNEYVKYRARCDNRGKLPVSINLRSKITGWSHYRFSNLFEYKRGVKYGARNGDSPYLELFYGGYINRESCENCQFKGYSRVSDLTIGDFWGIWDVAPEMDDNKGTSVVLVQSERGAALFEHIKEQLVLKPVSLEETSAQNRAMLKTSQPNAKRQETLDMIRAGKMAECAAWFIPPKPSFAQRIRSFARRTIHKLKNK